MEADQQQQEEILQKRKAYRLKQEEKRNLAKEARFELPEDVDVEALPKVC